MYMYLRVTVGVRTNSSHNPSVYERSFASHRRGMLPVSRSGKSLAAKWFLLHFLLMAPDIYWRSFPSVAVDHRVLAGALERPL